MFVELNIVPKSRVKSNRNPNSISNPGHLSNLTVWYNYVSFAGCRFHVESEPERPEINWQLIHELYISLVILNAHDKGKQHFGIVIIFSLNMFVKLKL